MSTTGTLPGQATFETSLEALKLWRDHVSGSLAA
jgi:hypothetical protein